MIKRYLKYILLLQLFTLILGCKTNQPLANSSEKAKAENWVGSWPVQATEEDVPWYSVLGGSERQLSSPPLIAARIRAR